MDGLNRSIEVREGVSLDCIRRRHLVLPSISSVPLEAAFPCSELLPAFCTVKDKNKNDKNYLFCVCNVLLHDCMVILHTCMSRNAEVVVNFSPL